MKCLECGKVLKQLNYNHLKTCCGLTPIEYKKKYNISSLMDEDIKEKCSSKGDKNPNWKGGITKILHYCKECGIKTKGRSKYDLCTSCTSKGIRNPFYGKTHNDTTRKKMVESNKLRDKSTYYRIVNDPDKISKRMKEMFGLMSKEERITYLRSWIDAGLKSNKKTSNTLIERKIKNWLDEHYIKYKQQININGRYPDFIIDNTIIECYGDYWHCNPDIYPSDYYHKNLKMLSEEKWDIDQKRIDIFKEMGYSVIILWESDIRYNNDFEKQLLFLLSGQHNEGNNWK